LKIKSKAVRRLASSKTNVWSFVKGKRKLKWGDKGRNKIKKKRINKDE
jgi:hypothetical protein